MRPQTMSCEFVYRISLAGEAVRYKLVAIALVVLVGGTDIT
jgi:hypothetical protein